MRGFRFGDSALQEQLTSLSDQERAFRYKINVSPALWMNYHSGDRLYSVTASDACFAVWKANWTVSANDDTRLISMVHHEVFQRAFDTLDNMPHVAGHRAPVHQGTRAPGHQGTRAPVHQCTSAKSHQDESQVNAAV